MGRPGYQCGCNQCVEKLLATLPIQVRIALDEISNAARMEREQKERAHNDQ